MTRTLLLPLLTLTLVLACDANDRCTPEQQGLEGATLLTLRKLPGRDAVDGPCARTRLELLDTPEKLKAAYDELGLPAPSVDFARERVVLREGQGRDGIQWATAQGNTAYIGLQACGGLEFDTCSVQISAMNSTTVSRVDAKSCAPVECGQPRRAPVKQL